MPRLRVSQEKCCFDATRKTNLNKSTVLIFEDDSNLKMTFSAETDVKNLIDMKSSLEGIKSIEEFRQKLMNGHLDKNCDPHKNGLASSDTEKSSSQESNQQKLNNKKNLMTINYTTS